MSFVLKVLGGRHYPRKGELLTLENGKKVAEATKGDTFISATDIRSIFPNRFELVKEIEDKVTAPAGKSGEGSSSEESEFPAADAAGLVVKSKRIKDKGVRYFVHDPDSPEKALNKKSLGKEEVEGFIAEYVTSKK